MIGLSPGMLVGAFDLLRLVERTPLTVSAIPQAFSKIGGMPSKSVLSFAQNLNWIESSVNGVLILTASGARILCLPDHQSRARAAILDYVEIVRPAWLQAALSGRLRVLAFAGTSVSQVLDEAGLVSGTALETVEFWDGLAARARGLRGDRLSAIGRIGERATLEYERHRTGLEPQWVAIDSNADGYDVLSVISGGDRRLLSIEVKATTYRKGGTIHLTRNEWDRAAAAEHHVFHLWRVDKGRPIDPPTVASVNDVRQHIPLDQKRGQWQEVLIPFDDLAAAALS